MSTFRYDVRSMELEKAHLANQMASQVSSYESNWPLEPGVPAQILVFSKFGCFVHSFSFH